jgi:lysyl-tRNA synthetase class I
MRASFVIHTVSVPTDTSQLTLPCFHFILLYSHHKPAPEPIVSTATFEIPSEQTDSSEQRKQALEDATRITEEYMKQAPAAAPQKVAPTFETPSEQREQALADAKRITEEKGVKSPEAALAWELVEELDATAAHHRTTGQG